MKRKLFPILLAALILLAGCQAQTAPIGSVPVPESHTIQATEQSAATIQTETSIVEMTEAPTEPATTERIVESTELATAESVPETTEPAKTEPVKNTEPTAPSDAQQSTDPKPTEPRQSGTSPTSCQHTFGADKTIAPTCTKGGYSERSCTRCGYAEIYKRTNATGHNWSSGAVHAASCAEGGYTLYTCTRCGATEKRNQTGKTAHSWGSWSQTKAPTCKAAGEEARSCTVCGKRETRTLDKLNHDWRLDQTVAPTCGAKGYDRYKCSRCGETEKRNETNALGHSWGAWAQSSAPTCTSDGSEARSCTRCGEKETRNVSKLGHDFQFTKTVAPTTSAEGYDLYTCTRCGATEQRNKVPKIKQKYDVNQAMEAGNNLARSYGCTIDYCMSSSNSSYYPPDATSGSYFDRNGGQERLNALAVENVQDTIDRLLYYENNDYDQLKLYHIRCLVLYIEETDVYDIWVFYG